jgi:hypothetical protein
MPGSVPLGSQSNLGMSRPSTNNSRFSDVKEQIGIYGPSEDTTISDFNSSYGSTTISRPLNRQAMLSNSISNSSLSGPSQSQSQSQLQSQTQPPQTPAVLRRLRVLKSDIDDDEIGNGNGTENNISVNINDEITRGSGNGINQPKELWEGQWQQEEQLLQQVKSKRGNQPTLTASSSSSQQSHLSKLNPLEAQQIREFLREQEVLKKQPQQPAQQQQQQQQYYVSPFATPQGNYDLGLRAVGSSSVAPPANPNIQPLPPGTTPEAAAAYLEAAGAELSNALAGLVTAADRAREARWQGDGELAFDSDNAQALEGRETQALALQVALTSAVRALAATSRTDVAQQASVVKMRDVLFTIISEVGKEVNTVLQGNEVSPELLSTISSQQKEQLKASREAAVAAAQQARAVSSSSQQSMNQRQGGSTSGSTSTPSFPDAKDHSSLEERLNASKQSFLGSLQQQGQGQGQSNTGSGNTSQVGGGLGGSTGSTTTGAYTTGGGGQGQQGQLGPTSITSGNTAATISGAVAAAAAAAALARARTGGPMQGGSMLTIYQKQDLLTDGLKQKGLIKSEENPTNRRMKAVFLTADEILSSLQARLLSLGLFKSLGNRLRQRRTGLKMLFLGHAVRALRIRDAMRRRAKLFSIGFVGYMMRQKKLSIRTLKILAVGQLCRSIMLRNVSRYRTEILLLGKLLASRKHRASGRRNTMLFAAGLFPALVRTKGEPTGYKYGVKIVKPKGPRVRGIYWDELKDVKGSVWDRKANNLLLLKQLFPDLKAAFTEKEKEKKSANAEAEEAAEKAKAEAKKEIKFIDPKDAQNMGIALSKFKTIIPDFKERRFVFLREALDRMDEVAIGGNDGIDIIESQLPRPGNDDKAKDSQEKYKKNMEEAKKFTDEESLRMALPENFLFEMSKVKRFEVRVKCLKLKNNFTEMEAAVRKDLTIFSAACADVLENKNLPVFLVDVIRPFGNELNRANGKKEATGIKISGLMKLAGTKTADNTMTSLYYIVTVLDQHRKELLELVNEFKNVPAAMKLSLAGTEGNLKACTKAKVDLLQAVADAKKDQDEVFLSAIGPFAQLVEQNVNALEADMIKLKENILLTASYLGEKDKSDTIDPINKPETLFKAWWDFVDVLLKTIQEYRKKEADKEKKAKEAREKEEAKMKKELAAMQKAEKSKKKGGGSNETSTTSTNELEDEGLKEKEKEKEKEKKPRRQVKKPTTS